MRFIFDQRGCPIDAQGRPFNVKGASLKDLETYLWTFDSYQRAEALWFAMVVAPSGEQALRLFLDCGNMCDAPWRWRSGLAGVLRSACAKAHMSHLLEPDARVFFDALPPLVPVWRGCEGGRERGISWTTERRVAEQFARGKRCINKVPTLVRAEIPKQHIFAGFVSRQEHEIAVDYRRLRKLSRETFDTAQPCNAV
jgi:hypothetical protein